MNLIHTEADESGLRATFGDEDGRVLEVIINDEGVIIDAFVNGGGTWLESKGMTAVEWFEELTGLK